MSEGVWPQHRSLTSAKRPDPVRQDEEPKMFWKKAPEGVILNLYVQPGAKKSEIVGPTPDGFLKIKIGAPATEGKANKKLIEFLAHLLDLRKSDLRILSGETGRKKRVLVLTDQPMAVITGLRV